MSRPKYQNDLKRSGAKIESYARVLIVCEGEKTEPNYFRELSDDSRFSTVNVIIERSKGNDPISVIKRAQDEYKDSKKKNNKYDEVFCVFDCDEHISFKTASDKARQLGFSLARSWPCFEIWFLFHFEYTRSPFIKKSTRSAGETCKEALIEHLPSYTKNKRGMFKDLEKNLEQAKINARRARIEAEDTENDNPSTEVHELIEYLQSIKK